MSSERTNNYTITFLLLKSVESAIFLFYDIYFHFRLRLLNDCLFSGRPDMERDVLYSSALSPRLPRHIHPHEADDLDNFTAHFTDYYNYQQGEVQRGEKYIGT